MKAAQAELKVMKGHEKGTNRLCWAVESTSGTKENGYPTFHVVTWDDASASWNCPCKSRKPCVHMIAASNASHKETERLLAVYDLLMEEKATQGTKHNLIACDEARDQGFPFLYVAQCDTPAPLVSIYEPIIARNDTGPRLFRETPKLTERVREVM